MIQAKIVTDSLAPTGERLTTLEVVMPRYILAEFNTHRVLSKNSASSRAIPFRKMIKSVLTNPFIPYAFQKDHLGMQGTEYFDNNTDYSLPEFLTILSDTFKYQSDLEFKTKEDKQILSLLTEITDKQKETKKTLQEWWLYCRDKAVKCAILMASLGVTKQLANRLLEPFMYHKVLVSGTEWENFFNLRCPQYTLNNDDIFKSRKDFKAFYKNAEDVIKNQMGHNLFAEDTDVIAWLKVNKGQADIHMMFLAEAIYDAINESTPKKLKEGEWHIPYGDNMDIPFECESNEQLQDYLCKISIARCARLSYQTLGDNPVIDYEKDLALYEILSKSGHWSPFEHVAKVMTQEEHSSYIKGKIVNENAEFLEEPVFEDSSLGWCRNFKGFIQYRELLDSNNN